MMSAVSAGLQTKTGVPCLVKINVRDNRLTPAGMAEFLRALTTIPCLQTMDLSQNQVRRDEEPEGVCVCVCGGGSQDLEEAGVYICVYAVRCPRPAPTCHIILFVTHNIIMCGA
jgi:hypothetical protein